VPSDAVPTTFSPPAPLILYPVPGAGSGDYIGSIARQISKAAKKDDTTLDFDITDGIGVNAFLFNAADKNFIDTHNSNVTSITGSEIKVGGQGLQEYAAAGTICSFICEYNNVTITPGSGANSPPTMKLQVGTNKDAQKGDTSLLFDSGKTQGIFFNMAVGGDPGIQSGTLVKAADDGSVSLTKPLTGKVNKGTSITFQSTLPWGIVQHLEPNQIQIFGLTMDFNYTPAAVATAVIVLDHLPNPEPTYLNVTVVASRTITAPDAKTTIQEIIPVNNDFYNVILVDDNPPNPDAYQDIPDKNVALYISLPPPPVKQAISVNVPTDGTPPNFWDLHYAMTQVDGTLTSAATLGALTVPLCKLLAYEIAWSQQNTLPNPPDPLGGPLYQSTKLAVEQYQQRRQ
jgi:hypothetical protein